ncbi:MAG: glycine cleavage system protein GcvH [Acidobacteria bacterium]|nr:MAG: glycine cleavage system protein GcvH [Acidobacteriota bacterium]
MKFPEDCLYTKQHEWVKVKGDTATVGITDYAQKELGDVVFVELPKVGDTFDTNEPFGNVESVKAVSEVFCPVAGEVLEVNQDLVSSPEWVNTDPYGDAWFVKLKVTDPEEFKELFNSEEYEEYVAEESAE